MDLTGTRLLSTMLAMAGVFLALSVLVQVVQEIYKYFTKSKSRLYSKVLTDSLGSWTSQLLRPEVAQQFLVRGPFQLWRSKPGGVLMPLDEASFQAGLERTTPPRVRQVLRSLEHEVTLQHGIPGVASPSWLAMLDNLGQVQKGSPGYWTTFEIAGFLSRWNHFWSAEVNANSEMRAIGPIGAPPKEGQFDAAMLLRAFRQEFLKHVDDAVEHYPQVQSNFEYSYGRRNLRQSFTFGLMIATIFNLPADRIYREAKQYSPEEAVALTEKMIEIYDRMPAETRNDDTSQAVLQGGVELLKELKISGIRPQVDYMPDWSQITEMLSRPLDQQLAYLFGCLITALLVSFGAPFWNDIASSLMRYQKSKGSSGVKTAKEGGQ